MRRALALLVATLVAAGCSGSGSGQREVRDRDPEVTSTRAPTTTTATASVAPPTSVRFTEVGRADQPVALRWCEGYQRPLVVEQPGKVRELGTGNVVLDLTARVKSGGEQGLLGLACRGDRLYVSYTNLEGDSRVDEVRPGGARRTLLAVDQPAANHNGGNLEFGPDGKLWLGLGDGGGADDQFDNAQEPGEVLGSMLRLDVDVANPKPEIMVKGVRNPWRWSFDRATGELWIGDVGQDQVEEIDRLPAGFSPVVNLGWPAFEGSVRFRKDVAVPADVVQPVFEYGRSDGQAVSGGYVYRGRAIPGLVGRYLFTDTYRPTLRVLDGPKLGQIPGGMVSSFAQDPNGELYVLSLAGGVYRIDPA